MSPTYRICKTIRFDKSNPFREPEVFNSIEIDNKESNYSKLITELYTSLLQGTIDETKDLKLYTHPGSIITRDMWISLKENTKIRKTLNKKNADLFAMSFKTFKKHIKDVDSFTMPSEEFIENVSFFKDFKEFCVITKMTFADFEIDNVAKLAKATHLFEKCKFYIDTLISNARYVDKVNYKGWKSYKSYEFLKHEDDCLYNAICGAILEQGLHNPNRKSTRDTIILLYTNESFNEIDHFISNKDKYINENNIKKRIQSDLAVIDQDMYKNILSMIKSSDSSNGILAVSILSSVNVTQSFGYITLIMYQCINIFSSHREWFTSSNAKSFLTQYNALCDGHMSKEFKSNIWLGSSFSGSSLPKRIEEPKILMELIKRSNQNSVEILSIIKEIMLNDFKNFISRSWMHNIINLEALCTSFDFKEDFKQQGVV